MAFDNTWDQEDAWWRENYGGRPYATGRNYEEFRPAYKYGYESGRHHMGRTWNDVETDLRTGWDRYEDRGTRIDLGQGEGCGARRMAPGHRAEDLDADRMSESEVNRLSHGGRPRSVTGRRLNKAWNVKSEAWRAPVGCLRLAFRRCCSMMHTRYFFRCSSTPPPRPPRRPPGRGRRPRRNPPPRVRPAPAPGTGRPSPGRSAPRRGCPRCETAPTPSLSEPTSRSRSPSRSRSARLRRAAPADLDAVELVAHQGERGSGGAAVVPVVVETARRFSDHQVQVSIAVQVAQRRHGVAAAGDGDDRRVHRLEPPTVAAVPREPRPPLPHDQIQLAVGIEVAERRRGMEPLAQLHRRAASGTRGGRPIRRSPADRRRSVCRSAGIELVREQHVEIAVAVEIGDRRNALAPDIEHGEEPPGPDLPRLAVAASHIVAGSRPRSAAGLYAPPSTPTTRSARPSPLRSPNAGALYPEVSIGLPTGNCTGVSAEVRRRAGAGVRDQQQPGLEEVAPEQIQVAVAVVIGQRHGVRAVHAGAGIRGIGRAGLLADDPDALELVRHQAERGRAACGTAAPPRSGATVPSRRPISRSERPLQSRSPS